MGDVICQIVFLKKHVFSFDMLSLVFFSVVRSEVLFVNKIFDEDIWVLDTAGSLSACVSVELFVYVSICLVLF